MRKPLVTLLLAASTVTGALGVTALSTGAASAATSTPGTAAATTDAARVATRTAEVKAAIAALVSSGQITQAQADRVASTLATTLRGGGRGGHSGRGGHGGPGSHAARGGHGLLTPAATAAAIGITEAELRTAHDAGQTLTQVAAAKGISKSDLISTLVTAGKAALAQAVTDGRLTQAQADAKAATLQADVTAKVDRAHRAHRARPARADDTTVPSTTPTTPATATTTATTTTTTT